MIKDRKLSDNVHAFLSRVSNDYGKLKEYQFSEEMYNQLLDSEINSPIEDLFFLAAHALAESAYCEMNPEPFFDERTQQHRIGFGVHLKQQVKIGKYRVDFLIESTDGPQPNNVVVELDGHKFHDKDKAQRAYEKARDRYLVKSGYRVLHYTGSEVVADPYKIAHEALSVLGIMDVDYTKSTPLGIE